MLIKIRKTRVSLAIGLGLGLLLWAWRPKSENLTFVDPVSFLFGWVDFSTLVSYWLARGFLPEQLLSLFVFLSFFSSSPHSMRGGELETPVDLTAAAGTDRRER